MPSHADFLEHLAAFADRIAFCPVALAVDRGRDSNQSGTLFELFDQYAHGVRDLFMGLHQNVLPDQFGRHESHGLIRDLILGKIARTVGQRLHHAPQ